MTTARTVPVTTEMDGDELDAEDAWRLARRHGLRLRMLAMLWGGFVWLGLALALMALSHALQAGGGAGLGLAPTHALGMGWLAATMIAMPPIVGVPALCKWWSGPRSSLPRIG